MVDIVLIPLAFAFLAAVVYTLVGLIPGTDETSSLAPLTLVLVLLGVPAPALLAWFIAAITAMETTNTVPAAIAAIPGSTMAVPFVNYCGLMRKLGVPHVAMRKLLAGSVVGTLVAIPIAVGFGTLLAPFGEAIKGWAPVLFTAGAFLVALLSRSRWAAVVSIFPVAFLIQGFQAIAKNNLGHPVFISIFLGIAIGPMTIDLLRLLSPATRQEMIKSEKGKLSLAPDLPIKGLFPNPFRILTGRQACMAAITSAISATTFTFSPVGMTVLLGEIVARRTKELYHRLTNALSVMDGVTNATYIAETLIPLIAFGIPLSPMALGPAAPLFNAPPRFSVEPVNNLHSVLSRADFLTYSLMGAFIGLLVSYPFCVRFARRACIFIFKHVSHEALIGCFLGLVVVLSYYEAGLLGIAIALSLAVLGGLLVRALRIHIGVLYMAFYASSWIVSKTVGIGSLF
ncbi:MAG: tripartite tricarboxylate transporter permease [Candidatus Hodarchaeota archaeon]